MKDAHGHGSNGIGGSAVVARSGNTARGIMPSRPFREGGGQPVSSNAQAAQALMNGLKSTMVPVHDSMAGRASNPTSAPSSSWDKGKHPVEIYRGNPL